MSLFSALQKAFFHQIFPYCCCVLLESVHFLPKRVSIFSLIPVVNVVLDVISWMLCCVTFGGGGKTEEDGGRRRW